MHHTFKRAVSALLSLTMALQPIVSAAANDFRYRIPIDLVVSGNAELEIQPELTDFGDVARTQMRTLPVKVVNHGDAAATGVSAVASAPFAVDKSCSTVPAHGECNMLVSFMPQEAGPQLGSLVVQASNGRAEGSLIGNAVRLLTDLEISENGWNFGTWKLGTTSTVKQLAVKNVGTAPATISQMYLLDGGSDFKMSHNCTVNLSPGSACIIAVSFTPSEMGQRVGALRVKSGDGSVRDVGMLGFGGDHTDPNEGGADGRLSAPDSVILGDVVPGDPAATKTITLANAGTKDLTLGAVSVRGVDASLFTANSTCPATLPAFGTCQVALSFAPTQVGAFSAELAVVTGAGKNSLTKSVALSGKGVTSAAKGQLSVNVSDLDFGSTALGAPVTRTVRVTNAGPDTAEITHTYATNSANFVVTKGCSAPLAADAFCDLTIEFTAKSVEQSIGDLVIASQAGQTLLVHLKGKVPSPVLQVSPGSLVFEATSQGDTAAYQELQLSNAGSAPLSVTNVEVSSTAEFNQSNGCGAPIAAAQSCTVRVQFTPNGSGARDAQLLVLTNDPVTPVLSVPLKGIGLSSTLQFSPSQLAFGQVTLGKSSTPATVTITSTGPGNALIAGVDVLGDGFTQVNTCGTKLAKDQSCTATVVYAPSSATNQSGYLRILSTEGSQMVPLSGTGMTPDQALVVNPPAVSLGSFVVGQGADRTITVSNTGDEALALNAPALSGEDAAAFATATTCGASLAPHANCTVTVSFTAQAVKAHVATLTISTRSGGRREIALVGNGVEHVPVAVLGAAPNPLNFGSATPSTPTTATLRISNAGPEAVSLVSVESSDTTNFRWSESDCPSAIAANGYCDLPIRFLGTTEGAVSAQLTLRSENHQTLSIPMRGQGPSPRVTVSKSTLDFGSVDFFATAAKQTVTVGNSGNARLAISGVSIEGAFSLANGCPVLLDPNASCDIEVGFSPAAGGAQAGKLHISSNDPATPAYQVALAGVSLLGRLAPSPADLNFGQVAMGDQVAQVVSIYNPGPGGVGISSITLEGLNKAAFSFNSDCGSRLAKDASCSVTARFSPQGSGAHEAALVLVPQVGTRQTVALFGSGPTARASLDASGLTFASTVVGETSAVQTVTLTNEGAGPLNVYDISMFSGNESFGVSSNCVSPLAVGQACPVYVAFTPASGGQQSGVLRVKTANSGGPLDVALSGTGLVPTAALSQTLVDFGTVFVGSTGENVVQVKNTGAYPVKVTGVGVPQSSAFAQNNSCGQTLQAGEACDIAINAAPSAPGTQSSTLTVQTTAGTLSASLSVAGRGVTLTRVLPSVASSAGGTVISVLGTGFTPSSKVYFGATEATSIQVKGDGQLDAVAPVHAAGMVDVSLVNPGLAPLKLPGAVRYVGAPTLTGIAPSTGTVAGGWAATLSGTDFVQDMKVQVEGRNAQIVSVAENGTSASIVVPARLYVTAGAVDVVVSTSVGSSTLANGLTYQVPQANLKISGSGDFGNVAVGASYGRVLKLTNAGALPAQLVGFIPDASIAGAFTVGTGGTCPASFPATLAPGDDCTIEVLASNSTVGTTTGTLTVTASGAAGGQVSVNLAATFVTADYALSGAPSSMTAVSGSFPTVLAMSEEGGTNGTQSKVVYLSNVLKAAGTRILEPSVTITGPDAGQFAITEVRKVGSSASSFTSAGASITPDKLSATGGNVDAGNGTYPHLGVVVTFAPKAKGSFNAQLNIDYNGGSRAQLPLFGKAEFYSYAALSATSSGNPAVIPNGDFGALTFNDAPGLVSDSTTRKFYLVSTSNAGKRLRATRLSVAGPDAASFAISAYTGRVASDGALPSQDISPANLRQSSVTEALEIVVRFSPARAGALEAQLLVEHNGDNAQPLAISLTGAGAHDVSVRESGGAYLTAIQPFPATGVGNTSTMDTFVRNTGTFGQVTWKAIQIVGSQAFSIKVVSLNNPGNTNSPSQQVQPAATRYVAMNLVGADVHSGGASDFRAQLAFTPTTAGVQNATVTVFHDGPGGKTSFNVTGEGLRASAALSATSSKPYTEPNGDFGVAGFLTAGDPTNGSVSRTINVVNPNALGLLRVTRLRITGADAGAFVIDSFAGQPGGYVPTTDVSPTAMVQGSSAAALAVRLKFNPTKLGTHAAQLEVYHDGMNTSPQVLPLSGTGSRDVILTPSEGTTPTVVEPTPFAATLVGGTSVEKTVYLRATGTAGAVTYSNVTVEGTPDVLVTYSSLVRQGATSAASPTTYPGGVASATLNLAGGSVTSAQNFTDLALRFVLKPTSLGVQTAKVTVTHNGPGGKSTFLLSGEGTQPQAGLSSASATSATPPPATGNFGSVSYTAGAPAQASTLSNYVVNTTSVGLVRVTRMAITGADAASFTLTAWPGKAASDPAQQDVSPASMVQSGTNGPNFKMSFTPSRLGSHTAQLAVYHNGSNTSPLILPLAGTGANDSSVTVSESPSAVVAPVAFAQTVAGSAATKPIYVRVSGSKGQVTFTGIKVEGSEAFQLTDKLVRYLKGVTSASILETFAAPVREAVFTMVGDDLSSTGNAYTDLGFTLRFAPTEVGTETAKVTVFHTGPGGKSEFMISGSGAKPIVQLSGTNSTNPTAANGDHGIATYNGATGAPAGTVTKDFFLVNTAKVGLASVPRMRIVGDDAAAFSFVTWTGFKTGENAGLDVAPTAFKQSTATTNLMLRVQFQPTKLGAHKAQLLVDHNGANTSPLTLNLAGEGARDVTGMFATVGVDDNGAIPDHANVTSLNNAALGTSSQIVNVRAVGTRGRVTYRGFKVEGSPAFSVASVYSVLRGVNTRNVKYTYSPRVAEATAQYVGEDLASASQVYTDYAVQIVFAPTTFGTETATVTVYHDGPGGQTSFQVRGTARTEMQLSSRPDKTDGQFGAALTSMAQTSASLPVYMLQVGGSSRLQLGTITLSGANADQFAIMSVANVTNSTGVEGTTLWSSPQGSQQAAVNAALTGGIGVANVVYKPTANPGGGTHVATLTVTRPGFAAQAVQLVGRVSQDGQGFARFLPKQNWTLAQDNLLATAASPTYVNIGPADGVRGGKWYYEVTDVSAPLPQSEIVNPNGSRTYSVFATNVSLVGVSIGSAVPASTTGLGMVPTMMFDYNNGNSNYYAQQTAAFNLPAAYTATENRLKLENFSTYGVAMDYDNRTLDVFVPNADGCLKVLSFKPKAAALADTSAWYPVMNSVANKSVLLTKGEGGTFRCMPAGYQALRN